MIKTIPFSNLKKHTADLFWGKVNVGKDSDCWEWTGADSVNGYGRVNIKGRLLGAHRVAYAIAFGAIDKHLCVLHKCDNRRCCNPNHLFLGTQKDNFHDASRKGRISNKFGTSAKKKLTDNQVYQIRILCLLGELPQWKIGKLFGVGQHHISRINSLKRRAHSYSKSPFWRL